MITENSKFKMSLCILIATLVVTLLVGGKSITKNRYNKQQEAKTYKKNSNGLAAKFLLSLPESDRKAWREVVTENPKLFIQAATLYNPSVNRNR
jgi:hypothetical protein